MDIVTRLKMFLDQTGISNSQFADTCEIPRPTLSQLLNGRNKKVSDEVIGKIHRAYPSLNVMWLMFGDGDMILAGNDAIEKNDNAAGTNTTNGNQNDDMGQQRAISFDDDEPMSYRSTPKSAQRITTPSMSETIQNIMRSNSASRMPQRGSSSSDGRSVVNIVVFYNDGRFEQFGPLK
jgi:transcriptional regulator with XRE-family HTH domain